MMQPEGLCIILQIYWGVKLSERAVSTAHNNDQHTQDLNPNTHQTVQTYNLCVMTNNICLATNLVGFP